MFFIKSVTKNRTNIVGENDFIVTQACNLTTKNADISNPATSSAKKNYTSEQKQKIAFFSFPSYLFHISSPVPFLSTIQTVV